METTYIKYDYLAFKSDTAFTFALDLSYSNSELKVQYSLDNNSWSDYTSKTQISVIDKIYLRGTGGTNLCNSRISHSPFTFTSAVNLKASGSVDALLDYTAESGPTLTDYCYCHMFENCTSLVEAPALPATTLTDHCYESMFRFCKSLIDAPSLPATILAKYCYNLMFYACSSLTAIPELSATTLSEKCYTAMFYNCTSLHLAATKTDVYFKEFKISISDTVPSTALDNMFGKTGGTWTGTPVVNTSYYIATPIRPGTYRGVDNIPNLSTEAETNIAASFTYKYKSDKNSTYLKQLTDGSLVVDGLDTAESVIYSPGSGWLVADKNYRIIIVKTYQYIPEAGLVLFEKAFQNINDVSYGLEVTVKGQTISIPTKDELTNIKTNLDDEATRAKAAENQLADDMKASAEQIDEALQQVKTAVESKQDQLVAGDNITIEGNVISATSGGDLTAYVKKETQWSSDDTTYTTTIDTDGSTSHAAVAAITATATGGNYWSNILVKTTSTESNVYLRSCRGTNIATLWITPYSCKISKGGEQLTDQCEVIRQKELTAAVEDKQDKLTIGTGITLTDNTIAIDDDYIKEIVNEAVNSILEEEF